MNLCNIIHKNIGITKGLLHNNHLYTSFVMSYTIRALIYKAPSNKKKTRR